MTVFSNHTDELPSETSESSKLNSLRAAVLGANDGIISVSSVAMGVAGATSDTQAVILAGLAALTAGALSMAVGEYVSVSSQSDAEKAYIEVEKQDLKLHPERELDELAREYQKLGVSKDTAKIVAEELTEKDALKAHLQVHFGLNPDDIVSPWQAAIASFLAFTVGGLVPFLVIVVSPQPYREILTVVAVLIALIAVGSISASIGGAPKLKATWRVVLGGMAAMLITYYVGVLFGAAV